MRVDWDGDEENPITIEVKISGSWVALAQAESPVNVQVATTGSVTQISLERGPRYPGVKFATKLLPIEWLSGTPPFPAGTDDITKTRGTHYDYADGVVPANVSWVESEEVDGVHCLALSGFDTERAYEVWVRVWHPTESGTWKDHDPIIRTDGSYP